MFINHTGCCAVREICDISKAGTPAEVMNKFCEFTWGYTGYGAYAQTSLPLKSVSGLYTFTGDVRHTDGSHVPMEGKYGPDFAAFIKRNKLGKVVMSAEGVNRVNHPTHVVRLWAWSPDVKALQTWFKGVRDGKT